MDPANVERLIREHVSITRQRVVLAKAIILDATPVGKQEFDADELIQTVLRTNEATYPPRVVIHESVDTMASVRRVAAAISWEVAAREAIWALIHTGSLLPLQDLRGEQPQIAWTTVPPQGGSGHSGGCGFPEYRLPVPSRLRRAWSSRDDQNQYLSDPDLYLHTIGVPTMHADVVTGFNEAVKCFRNELFTASLAMLGKASEGAWLELGEALLRVVGSTHATAFDKQRRVLDDPNMGPFHKVKAVIEIYERQDVFRPLERASGVTLAEVRSVAPWSDVVRESRNTIHFGVKSVTPNTYEKLAALLLSAVPHVRTLYRLKATADAMVVGSL